MRIDPGDVDQVWSFARVASCNDDAKYLLFCNFKHRRLIRRERHLSSINSPFRSGPQVAYYYAQLLSLRIQFFIAEFNRARFIGHVERDDHRLTWSLATINVNIRIIADRVDPSRHGIAIAWLRTATDAGMLVGPLVMGPLADAVDLAMPFLMAAIISCALAWACYRYTVTTS